MKEARIKVETSEKIRGYRAVVGEFEIEGQKPLGPGKGPKKFLKIGFFEKMIGNVGAAVMFGI